MGYLLVIQGYKTWQNHSSSFLQSQLLLKATQRKGLKQNANFSITQHLKEAFDQYYTASFHESSEDAKYDYFSHQYFGDFIADHSDLISSARKHLPIMDKDTYTNLHIFVGPDGSQDKSYCKLLFKQLNIRTSIGRYNVFVATATANKHSERIKEYQQRQRIIAADEKCRNNLTSIFDELTSERCDRDMMDFYLRDRYTTNDMHMIKYSIRADHLIPPSFLHLTKRLGFNLKSLLEESQLGAFALKWIHLPLRDLEYIINLDRLWTDLSFSGHTLAYYLNKLLYPIFSIKIPGNHDKNNKYAPPIFSNGLMAKTINLIWSIGTYPFSFLHTDKLIHNESTGGKILDQLYFMLTFSVYALNYMFRKPLNIFETAIYRPYINTFGPNNRYELYAKSTNAAIKFLKQLVRLRRLMRKFEKTIKKNDELMQLCEAYLKPIDFFLHSPSLHNIHDIIREAAQLDDTPVTPWDIFTGLLDSNSSNSLSLMKRLDELPEEEEKAWMDAYTALCLFEPFVCFAAFSVETAQKKSSLGFTFANIIETQEKEISSTPDINLQGIYSIFIPRKTVVKNSFSNVRDPKTGEEKVLTIQGLNGGGKSIFIRSILENIVLGQSMGCIYGDQGDFQPVDYIRYHANITDDPAKGLSLMMAETKKLNEVLALVDGMAPGEKGLFILDEPGKGTTTEESGPLLLSTISYIQQKKNSVVILSTHISTIFDIAKTARYNKLAPFTPGFNNKKGFTYKIDSGMAKSPVCIRVLEEMNFHKSVLKGTVGILAEDPNYRFRHQLKTPVSKGVLGTLFGSSDIEKGLLFLFILIIGMLLGSFLPNNLRKKDSKGKKIKFPDIS